jgi:micrococcal nuclease|tara:strand:+ start:428 stop:784 length:357 start_codon:yes stop_codon:yes gene_type:complete
MYEYRAEVLRVVDGDTVDVLIDCGFSTFRKERIRLHGIDAPESRTKDKEEKVRGLAAKARLQELIKNTSKKVVIKTKLDKKGKYGRILGVIWDEGKKKNFNKMLVTEGHAKKYLGGKK